MTLININQFFGSTEEDFVNYLEMQPRYFYEIVIPKEYSRDEDGLDFLTDYYKAIWLGQLLYRISDDFLCTSPNPYKKGEFNFIIITGKIKALARMLVYFCSVYDWKNNEESCIEFEGTCIEYENCLKEGEEFACSTYVEFLNAYAEGEDEGMRLEMH